MSSKEIQYYHCQSSSLSACCKVPSVQEIIDLIKRSTSFDNKINIEVGVAKVHPDDMFCYKTGREVSRANMSTLEFMLTGVRIDEEYIFVGLYHESKSIGINLEIRKGRQSAYFTLLSEI